MQLEKICTAYGITTIFFLGKTTVASIPRRLDLIVCKDVFTQLTLTQTLDALDIIKASGAKYLLATTFLNRKNSPSEPYKCLFNTPFSFPPPLELSSECCMNTFPNYVDKSLGLWRVVDIPDYIPRSIYQCWHAKELPELLHANCARIRTAHPGFTHKVFSFEECETFIAEHFHPKVLRAYQTLIPAAYKCDLWRYCILYTLGGIYVDISFELNNFSFLDIINKEHFSSEIGGLFPYEYDKYRGVSNGLMILRPKNQRMSQIINAIVDNVEKQFYGKSPYDITGAVLLGSFFTRSEKRDFLIQREVTKNCNRWTLGGRAILDRIKDYDKGMPGRNNGIQQYITLYWGKKVYATSTT